MSATAERTSLGRATWLSLIVVALVQCLVIAARTLLSRTR
jgi:hypothetical protein